MIIQTNFVGCQVITRDKEKQAMLEQVILAMVKWVIMVASFSMAYHTNCLYILYLFWLMQSLRMKKMLKMLKIDLMT